MAQLAEAMTKEQLREKLTNSGLVLTSNAVFEFMWQEIESRDNTIDVQEDDICDLQYLVAELSGESEPKTTEELKEKFINEGLGIKKRLEDKDKEIAQWESIFKITTNELQGQIKELIEGFRRGQHLSETLKWDTDDGSLTANESEILKLKGRIKELEAKLNE